MCFKTYKNNSVNFPLFSFEGVLIGPKIIYLCNSGSLVSVETSHFQKVNMWRIGTHFKVSKKSHRTQILVPDDKDK